MSLAWSGSLKVILYENMVHIALKGDNEKLFTKFVGRPGNRQGAPPAKLQLRSGKEACSGISNPPDYDPGGSKRRHATG